MGGAEILKLKYPIGRFSRPSGSNDELRKEWIESITLFPQALIELTQDLNKEQLEWRYRPDGWSIKQVVHHCADSHMNSLIRFKLALTEDAPTIKAYHEERWAELSDSLDPDLSAAILILVGVHRKWVVLLKDMKPSDFEKTFIHPESGKHISLNINLALYAWHSEHHLAHIRQAIKNKGEFDKK